MGRTLYLNESAGDLHVKRDGPSVWITARETAGRRVPARLLSRVVVMGNVKLDARAITLFAEHDIPVVFMDNRAEETAMAIPYNHRLPSHYEEQKVFLESDANASRYEQWALAKRAVLQADVLRRFDRSLSGQLAFGIGEGNYQQVLSGLKPKSEDKWSVVTGIINSLFRGLIMEHVLKADLDPHTGVIHRRHNFGFVLDICYIVGAESDMQAVRFFRAAREAFLMERRHSIWNVTEPGMRDIIHRFENRRKRLSNLVGMVLDEVFELMREVRL